MSWVFPLLLDTKMGSIFISLLCHYLQYFGFSLITRDKGEVYFYPLSFVIVIPVFDFTDVQPTSPPTRGRGGVLHFVLSGFLEIPFHVAVHITGTLFFSLCFFLTSENKRFACDIPPDGQPRRVSVDLMIFNCQGNRRKGDFGHGLEGRF